MASTMIASDRLRERYGVYVRVSLIAAAAMHFLLFYFCPAFEIEPYEYPEPVIFEGVPPVKIEIPPPPPEVRHPQPDITLSPDGTSSPDINDIPPNVFDTFGGMPVRHAPPPAPTRNFHVFDESPVLLTFTPPVYPDLARQAGIEGTVLLRVLVDEDGTVLSADVIHSDVTPPMEAAAVAAAMRFVFRPAMQGTNPVRAYMAVPVTFKLR